MSASRQPSVSLKKSIEGFSVSNLQGSSLTFFFPGNKQFLAERDFNAAAGLEECHL